MCICNIVFNILDKLPPTATGMDQLPAWFLWLGAPVFSKPITHLFNIYTTSSQPLQCPINGNKQLFNLYLRLLHRISTVISIPFPSEVLQSQQNSRMHHMLESFCTLPFLHHLPLLGSTISMLSSPMGLP